MNRVLNPEIGAWFAELHRRHGVRTILGVGVEGIHGEQGNLRIQLTDGNVLDAATVLVGIGATPNEEWLKTSGLLVDNGVVCDEHCRAVEEPDVFAVGDVARWFHPRYGVDMRVEHWTNAVDQAICVAHNIAHPSDLRPYAPIAYVWSDQHDWKIQVTGRTGGISEHVVIGDPHADNKFAALYTEDGQHLSGAAIVNWPRALIECRRALSTTANLVDLQASLVAARNRTRAPTNPASS